MKKSLLTQVAIACFLFLLNSEYARGQVLSIADSVVYTYCGEATGSITISIISGQSPFSYTWSIGATTSNISNLAAGTYNVTVYDNAGDSLLNEYVIAYLATWDTLVKFTADAGGGITALNPQGEHVDCFASLVNSLSPGQDGWIEFVVDSGEHFNGVFLVSDNLNFDETTNDVAAFYIHDSIVELIGTGINGYLGSFNSAGENRFRIEFTGDTVRFLRYGSFESEYSGGLSFYHSRNNDLSPAAVGFTDGSRLAALYTSFGCGNMKTTIRISPAENVGEAGNAFVTVKGGSAPYTYSWSRGDNTTDLLVAPVGEYALTITDQNNDSISRNVFLGGYADWYLLNNLTETPAHHLIFSGTPDYDADFPGYAIGENELQPDSSGIISFDFMPDSTFAGIVGAITNFIGDNSGSDSLQFVWIAIIPDSISEEISEGGVYILHNVEGSAGSVDYVGKWRKGLPLNVKIYAKDDSITVVKNDIKSLTYSYPRAFPLCPFAGPFLENSIIQSVTLNFGKRIKLNSNVTSLSCDSNTLGGIMVTPERGIPPYQYLWSNGATASTIYNLNIGDYSVTVSDSMGYTITQNYRAGFKVSWDTLPNISLQEDGSLEYTVSDSTGIGLGLGGNTLYTGMGGSGWLDFNIGGSQWTDYVNQSMVGFSRELPFPLSDTIYHSIYALTAPIDSPHQNRILSDVTMIVTAGIYLMVLSTDTNIGYQFLGKRSLSGSDDIIHFEIYHGDSLRISMNDKILIESKCNYPDSIKPFVLMLPIDGNDETGITSKIKQVTASFCNELPLRVQTEVMPAENIGTAGSIDLSVSEGRPPYSFEWSNGATTEDLANIRVGEYQLSITEQGSYSAVKNIFLGGYVDWEMMNNMEETDSHKLIVTSDSAGNGGAFGYSIGSNELDSDSSGIISFDFSPDSIFGGVIGITNFFQMLGELGNIETIVIGIVPDSSSSVRRIYILHSLDSAEADPVYIGEWNAGLPLNIKLNVKGDSVTVLKNDIWSFRYAYPRNAPLYPVVIPNLENSSILRVTCNFGEQLKVYSDIMNVPCDSAGTGSISVTVEGGVPPYHYLWSSSNSGTGNGATTSTISNLNVGDYQLTVTDSIGNAAFHIAKVGYTLKWDPLVRLTQHQDGSLEPDTSYLLRWGLGLGANTFYTGVGETGWMEFKIDSGDKFIGVAGFITPLKFPLHKSSTLVIHSDSFIIAHLIRVDSAYANAFSEFIKDSSVLVSNNDSVVHIGSSFDSIVGIGIAIFKNIYVVASTDSLLTGEYWEGGGLWGILDTTRNNVFRIERNHRDSICILLNNKAILNSHYSYPIAFKPAVLFMPYSEWDTLGQNLGKIKYVAASFCNDSALYCRDSLDPVAIIASYVTAHSGTQIILTATSYPGATMEWFANACGNSGVLVATGDTLNINVDSSATYYVRNKSYCPSSDTLMYSRCLSKKIGIEINAEIVPVTCGGPDTGRINITVDGGGIPPYQFLWSNGATTQSISNLGIGHYAITVTDSIGEIGIGIWNVGNKVSWNLAYHAQGNPDGSLEYMIPDSGSFTGFGIAANTTYPAFGETGWVDYTLERGSKFLGFMGLSNGTPLYKLSLIDSAIFTRLDSFNWGDHLLYKIGDSIHESDSTLAHYPFVFVRGRYYVSGGPDAENIIAAGILDTLKENTFSFERFHTDSIRIRLNGNVIVNAIYSRPLRSKPFVIFSPMESTNSLPQDFGKLKLVTASFCNDSALFCRDSLDPVAITTAHDTLCGRSQIALSATAHLGATMQWYTNDAGDSGIFIGTGHMLNISADTSATYFVRNRGYCPLADSIMISRAVSKHITVLPKPEGSVSPRDTTIWAGDPVTLTVSGGESYLWLSNYSRGSSLTVHPINFTTSYIVYTYDSVGCADKDTSIVRLKTLPEISVINYRDTIESGDTTYVRIFSSLHNTSFYWSRDTNAAISGVYLGTGDEVSIPLDNNSNARQEADFHAWGEYQGRITPPQDFHVILGPQRNGPYSGNYVLVNPVSISTGTITQPSTINLGCTPSIFQLDVTNFTNDPASLSVRIDFDAPVYFYTTSCTSPNLSPPAGLVPGTTFFVDISNLAAGATTSICYATYGACEDFPTASPYNTAHQLNPVSHNQTFQVFQLDHTTDFTGYYVGRVGARIDTPRNYEYNLNYPYLSYIGSTSLDYDINYDQGALVTLDYINSGTAEFNGVLELTNILCSSTDMSIEEIKISVDGQIPVDFNSAYPPFNPPLVSEHQHIPPGEHFSIIIKLKFDDCIPSQCTTDAIMNWGCILPLCRTTAPVHLVFNPISTPYLVISRITPTSPCGTDGYDWDNSCTGQPHDWAYLIENLSPCGGPIAHEMIINLNTPHGTNTIIDFNDVDIDISTDPNSTDACDYCPDLISGLYNPLPHTLLTSNNFDPQVESPCFDENTSVQSIGLSNFDLCPGQSLVLSFTTLRCCPDNNDFGDGVYFNHWNLNVSYLDKCNGRTVAIDTGGLPYLGGSTILAFDQAADPLEGHISSNQFESGADLILTQQFQPQNLTLITGGTSGCSQPEGYHVTNVSFPGENINSSDFDTQLFSDDCDHTADGVTGVDLHGHFEVIFRGTNNVHPVTGGSNNPRFESGINIWNPVTGTTWDNGGAGNDWRVQFDLFPAFQSSRELREFLQHSAFNFWLEGCCPITNTALQNVSIEFYFNPEGGTSLSTGCPSCNIPLTQHQFQLSIICPGCITPGMQTTKSTFERITLGYEDDNDDGVPDDAGPGSHTLIPMANDPNYLSDHEDDLRKDHSIAGDILETITEATFQPGIAHTTDGTGFNLANFNADCQRILEDLYFNQAFSNGAQAHLELITDVALSHFDYIPVDPTALRVDDIPLPTPRSDDDGNDRQFLFHITPDYIENAMAIGGIHFLEGDQFSIRACYRTCDNPLVMLHINYTNVCGFVSPPLSAADEANHLSGMTHLSEFYDDLLTSEQTGANAICDDGTMLFLCQAGDDAGINHYIYPVVTRYTETPKDHGDDYDGQGQSFSSCQKFVIQEISCKIEGGQVQVFPYEYRMVPGIDPGHLNRGLQSVDGQVIFNFQVPAGFEATVFNTCGLARHWSGWSNEYYATSVSGDPLLTYINQPTAPLVGQLSGTYSANVNPPSPTVEFIPPFDDMGLNSYILPVFHPATILNDNGLLIGDEEFRQRIRYDLTPLCSSVDQSATIPVAETNVSVPNFADLCPESLPLPSNLVNGTDIVLNTPHPNFSVTSTLGDYSVVGTNRFIDFVITFQNPNGYSPNFYLEVPISSTGGELTLSCVSETGQGQNCLIETWTSGGYNIYFLPNYTLGGKDFYLRYTLNAPCSTNATSTIHIPFYYSWSCQSLPDEPAPPVPPDDTHCSNYDAGDLEYTIPMYNIITSENIVNGGKTCEEYSLTACMNSVEAGGVFDLTGTITLPGDAENLDIHSTPTGMVVDPAVDNLDGTKTYTMHITGGGSTIIVGNDGFNNHDQLINQTPLICVNISYTPHCGTTSIPLSNLVITGKRFCDMEDITPLNFPFGLFNRATNSYEAFQNITNGCGPFIDFTPPGTGCGWSTFHFSVSGNQHTGLNIDISVLDPAAVPATVLTATQITANSTNYQFAPTIMGTYTIVATSADNCSVSATVSEPALTYFDFGDVEVNGNVLTPISQVPNVYFYNSLLNCRSDRPTITLFTNQGGIPTYNYQISGSNRGTINVFSDLDPWQNPPLHYQYNVIIWDGNDCKRIRYINFISPPEISIISNLTNSVCFGSNSGSITTSVSGGSPFSAPSTPYNYLWGNAATSNNVTNLAAGSYSFTVNDSHNCSTTASFEISEPDPITITEVHQNLLCNSPGSGSIDISVSGGVGNYTYEWNDDDNSQVADLINLPVGSYTVTVTDGNQCTATITIEIIVSNAISLAETHTDGCIGGTNGSITITPSGGTAPYMYSWIDGSTTSSLQNLSSGNYSVTVTDANSCTASASVAVAVIALPTVSVSASHATICNGGSSTLTATASAGSGSISTYAWSSGISGNVSAGNVSPTVTTTYTVTVTNSNSCSASTSAEVTVNANPAVSASAIPPSICDGGNTTLSTTLGSGSGTISTYVWNNGITGNLSGGNVSPASTTTYSVTVANSNSCTASASVAVTVNGLPTVSVSASHATICNGGSSTLTATASAGSGSISTYVWSSGISGNVSSGNVSPTITTTYTVTVTNSNSCSASTSAEVTVYANPAVSAFASPPSICDGGNTTLSTTLGSGSGTISTYVWNNGITGNLSGGNVSPASTMTYSVTVTNSNSCTASASVAVTVNALPTVSVSASPATICYEGSSTLTATASAGSGSISTYAWSSGISGNFSSVNVSPTVTTTYSVTVTNSNSCSASASQIVVVTQATVSLSTPSNPFDACGNNSVNISTTTSLAGNLSYQWNPNSSNTSSITVFLPGTYLVTVSDGICSATGTYNLASNNCCVGDVISGTSSTYYINGTSSSGIRSSALNTTQVSWFNNNSHRIAINGRFIIDNNFTIFSCPDIVMGENSSIEIENGKLLNIYQSKLHTCGNFMWAGIKLLASSSVLNINKISEISDALIAVQSNNGGQFYLGGSTFSNNYICVSVQNVLAGFGSTVLGCTFSNPALHLKGALALERTQIGIQTNQVQGWAIGSESDSPGNTNTFTGINCGIFGYRSELKVYNNHFDNIRRYSCSSNSRYPGWAIYSENPSWSTDNFDGLTVRTSYSIPAPTDYAFRDCDGAIYAQNVNFGAWQNNINSCRDGIKISSGIGKFNGVVSNFFSDVYYGITLTNNRNAWALIYDNQIHNYWDYPNICPLLPPSPFISSHGVYITETINPGTNSIEFNEIYQPHTGIKTLNTSAGTEIINNTVDLTDTRSSLLKRVGISVTNSNATDIRENSVMGNGPYWLDPSYQGYIGYGNVTAQSEYRRIGILADASLNLTMSCNHLGVSESNIGSGIGRGICFRQRCNTDNFNITENYMIDNYINMYLEKLGGVSPEITYIAGSVGDVDNVNRNKFIGNTNPGGYETYNYTAGGSQVIPTFYYKSNDTYKNDDNFSNLSNYECQLGVANSTAQTVLSCVDLNYPTLVSGGGDPDLDAKKATGTVDYTANEDFLHWLDVRELYQRLDNDQEYQESNSVLANFYEDNQRSAIGQLNRVEKLLTQLKIPDTQSLHEQRKILSKEVGDNAMELKILFAYADTALAVGDSLMADSLFTLALEKFTEFEAKLGELKAKSIYGEDSIKMVLDMEAEEKIGAFSRLQEQMQDTTLYPDSASLAEGMAEATLLREDYATIKGQLTDTTTDEITAELLAILNEAHDTLQQVDPQNEYEANEKKTLEWIIKIAEEGIDSLTSDDWEAIGVLAASCPLTEGYAVYTARALYTVYDHTIDYNDLELCNEEASYKTDESDEQKPFIKKQSKKELTFASMIYDNQGNQVNILYKFEDGVGGQIEVHDLLGRLLVSANLLPDNNRTSVHLPTLASGPYLYNIRSEKGFIQNGKFMVPK